MEVQLHTRDTRGGKEESGQQSLKHTKGCILKCIVQMRERERDRESWVEILINIIHKKKLRRGTIRSPNSIPNSHPSLISDHLSLKAKTKRYKTQKHI